MPMFSQYSCINVKDMQLDSLNAEANDRLTALVSDVPESTILLFSMPTAELNMKSAKGKKALALFEKYGAAINFSHPDARQLAKLIEKGAAERGCQFAYAEAEYLLSAVGHDMSTVLNELEKICAYKKEGKVTTADIDKVTVKSVQARAFDLAKALMSNNSDKAMSILDALFYMKEEPINILGAIIAPYVDLYRAKVYISGGLRAEDAAKHFDYKNKEFRLTNAARSASKYSISQLRTFLDLLYEADSLLKSTSLDGRLILEQTITKFLLVANGEKI